MEIEYVFSFYTFRNRMQSPGFIFLSNVFLQTKTEREGSEGRRPAEAGRSKRGREAEKRRRKAGNRKKKTKGSFNFCEFFRC